MHYIAPPTVARFMQSSARARFIVGPLGSGKTMGALMELFRRSLEQAPDAEGVRPTRMVIVRNTMSQLRNTVLADIRGYLGPLVKFHVTDAKITFNVPLQDGTVMDSEWLLVPLDSTEDVRKLLSLQITGAFLEEFREINYDIVASILGRCGRYPPVARVRPSWYGLIGSSNPYNDGDAWCEALEGEEKPGWAMFRQPSGLSPEAENVANLPPNYYQDLAAENSVEWTNVHVRAMNGDNLGGLAVFKSSLVPANHLVDELIVHTGRALIIGLDLGRTPCAIFIQQDHYGRTLVVDEVTSEDMGLEQFLQTKLRPAVADPRYAGCRVIIGFDPAGTAKSQLSELSAWDVLKNNGWVSRPAPTNAIDPRLRAIERDLLQTRVVRDETGATSSTPALLVDRSRCPTLARALRQEYKYRRRKDGQVEDVPEKSHPWSDVVDALGYGIMSFNSGMLGKIMAHDRRLLNPAPAVSAMGWT